MSDRATPERSEEEALAAAVLDVADVAAMSAGPIGQFRSYLPGGRSVPGIRAERDTVDINVIAVYGAGLPELGARIATALGPLLRGRKAVVHVDDVVLPGEPAPDRADSLVDGPNRPPESPRADSDH